MLDCQLELLKQIEYKSQLSAEFEREFIVRFGREAFNALPNYPGAPEPERRSRKVTL